MTSHWITQYTVCLCPLSQYWKVSQTFAKKVYRIEFYVLGSTILNIFLRSDIWILQIFPRVTYSCDTWRKTQTSLTLISKQYSWDNLQKNPQVYFVNHKSKVINNVQWVHVGLAQLSWIKCLPLCNEIKITLFILSLVRWNRFPYCQASDKLTFATPSTEKSFNSE